MTMPWLFHRTITREFDCPWSNRVVTVRLLTCDGEHPVGMIGCSEKNCDLKCLREPALVSSEARVPAARR